MQYIIAFAQLLPLLLQLAIITGIYYCQWNSMRPTLMTFWFAFKSSFFEMRHSRVRENWVANVKWGIVISEKRLCSGRALLFLMIYASETDWEHLWESTRCLAGAVESFWLVPVLRQVYVVFHITVSLIYFYKSFHWSCGTWKPLSVTCSFSWSRVPTPRKLKELPQEVEWYRLIQKMPQRICSDELEGAARRSLRLSKAAKPLSTSRCQRV